jgi:glycosyltransferase involved in cell wall biosynthesis
VGAVAGTLFCALDVMSESFSSAKPIVMHVIFGLGAGGAENALFTTVSSSQHDVRSIVVSLGGGGITESRLRQLGVVVHIIDARSIGVYKAFVVLLRLLRDIRPNVLQTWMYYSDLIGGVAARIAGVKRIVWGVRRSDTTLRSMGIKSWLTARISGCLSWFIPHAVVCCALSGIRAHSRIGYARHKFFYIPNSYDSRRFPFRSDHAPRGPYIMGTLARFVPDKGYDLLIDAVKGIDDVAWELWLAGPGVSVGNTPLMDLIDSSGISGRVRIVGEVSDPSDYYRKLDLFLLPSRTEGFPNVVVEAMASGVPVVARDVGDVSLILSGVGWIADGPTVFELELTIRKALDFLESGEGYSDLVRAGASVVNQRYTLEAYRNAYLSVWKV